MLLRMASWNVNGLRACMGKGFMDFFSAHSFDLFSVQETKMQPEQADYDFPGYFQFWNSAKKKGYSGTAVLTKKEPLAVTYGMGIEAHDQEGRIITLEFDRFFYVTVYTPNSKRELLRLDYRMLWEDDFRAFLCRLAEKKPVVICGDLNVAHREIDLKNPKTNVNNAGFTPQERDKMSLLLSAGFIDTFRLLYPDRKDAYSWWSFMQKARERNVGWRIDYYLASDVLKEAVREAVIYNQIFGSDHCPVGLTLDL